MSAKRSKMGNQFAPAAVGMDSIQGGLYRRGAKTHRVNHTEYVSDISGTTGFAVRAIAINPGQAALFPWLSQIASRYEKYRFRSLRFVYQTEKSTATSGTVMFAIDYDAEDDVPSTKTQLLQNEDKERGAPWQKFHLQCQQHNLRDTLARFVRPGAVPSGVDVKTYDLGTLLIGTSGMADTSDVGELYVEYDIELETPVLEEQGTALNHSMYSVSMTNSAPWPNGGPSQVPFPREVCNPDPSYYGNDGYGNLRVPAGAYLVSGWFVFQGAAGSSAGSFVRGDLRLNNFSQINNGGTMLGPGFDIPVVSTDNVNETAAFSWPLITKDGDLISFYIQSGNWNTPTLMSCTLVITAV